jgi:predicted peroxiredoxin
MSSAGGEPTRGLAILLWAAEPEAPHRLVTPFFHAAAAAAMDLPVELYFSARSVLLLRTGLAETLRASPHHPKTVADAMREALDHGARFRVCTDALHAQGLDWPDLIPEGRHRGGAVQFVARACDPAWSTLVF